MIIISCNRETESVKLNPGSHNFENYIDNLIEDFSKKEKEVIIDFNFLDEENIKINSLEEVDLIFLTVFMNLDSDIFTPAFHRKGKRRL